MALDQVLRTVSIERRGYGRRYSWLPVDQLDRDGFAIDCTDAYVRPHMIDIQVGDIARWHEEGRLLEGQVAHVWGEGEWLHVHVEHTRPMPPETFYP